MKSNLKSVLLLPSNAAAMAFVEAHTYLRYGGHVFTDICLLTTLHFGVGPDDGRESGIFQPLPRR